MWTPRFRPGLRRIWAPMALANAHKSVWLMQWVHCFSAPLHIRITWRQRLTHWEFSRSHSDWWIYPTPSVDPTCFLYLRISLPNPGNEARFQKPTSCLPPVFTKVSGSYWGNRRQRRERTCVGTRKMSNCVSLINKIPDPKYLLHGTGTSFAFISTPFPCWVRETAPYLREKPSSNL